MKRHSRPARPGERGFALAVVLTMILLLTSIAAALHVSVMGNTVSAAAHYKAAAGFYAAESGINRGMGSYRNIFLNYGIPTGSPGTGDFAVNTFTLGNRTVTYQLAEVPGNPDLIIVPGGKPFAGLTATEYRYTATATSAVQSGEIEANIGTQFNVDYIPLFQFLAFYQNDLEILPGVDMNLHGPVHTNGALYLNANTTLTVTELNPDIPSVHLSAAGNIYRGRKNDSTCTGTVRISKLEDANDDDVLDTMDIACGGSSAAMSSSALSNWLGALAANQPVVSVPTPDALVIGSGEFWTKADLRIALDVTAADSSGLLPIRVLNAAGNTDATLTTRLQSFISAKPGRIFYNDVPTGSPTATTGTPCPAGSYCNMSQYTPAFSLATRVYGCLDTDLGLHATWCTNVNNKVVNETRSDGQLTARRGGFYNNREHAWVYMLNVNAHDLLAWNRAQASGSRLFDPADTTDGGVVLYLTVTGPGSIGVSTPRYGVRVFGSPNLDFPSAADPTGITVVSDQAMYVEGDYNTGGGPCTSHASCPKMPSALMADTINVLSNGWSGNSTALNDFQSFRPLNERPASSTTIRAAFLSGVDTTTSGNYNGGLENYPRFHETWSGDELDYRGSFVSLGTPRHNNGSWCGTGTGCNIYNPPVRNWDYDTDFQTVENLPPLTPRFVSVEQILFTENFR
jgi:hypothetical protein